MTDQETCKTCRYWLDTTPFKEVTQGECHRLPPVMRDGAFDQWPAVTFDDWCGEHKPTLSDKPWPKNHETNPLKYHGPIMAEAASFDEWVRARHEYDLAGGYLPAEGYFPAEHVAVLWRHLQTKEHASDCAVHNMPAFPNGPCDCQPEDARVTLKLGDVQLVP